MDSQRSKVSTILDRWKLVSTPGKCSVHTVYELHSGNVLGVYSNKTDALGRITRAQRSGFEGYTPPFLLNPVKIQQNETVRSGTV